MKLFLKLAAIAALGLVLLGLAFVLGLDRLVAEAIRRGATYATGVETTLGSADVGLTGGSLSLSELRIANPAGFEAQSFLELSAARVALETGSLFERTIVVDEIVLDGLSAALERKAGRTNFGVILANLERLGGDAGPQAEPAPPSGGEHSLHVRRIRLRDIRAEVRLDLLGSAQTMRVQVPEVLIDDFHSDGDTRTLVAELTRAVIQALLGAVVEFGGDLPSELLSDLRGRLGGLEGRVEERASEVLRELGEATEKLPAEIRPQAEKAVDEAKKALDGLLGGKKKKE